MDLRHEILAIYCVKNNLDKKKNNTFSKVNSIKLFAVHDTS